MQRVQATEYHQAAADRFERTCPGFYPDEAAEAYPTLPEAILWAASVLLMVLLFSAAMGADFTKILWLVAR